MTEVKDQKIRTKKNKHGIPVVDLPVVENVPVKFGFLEKPIWKVVKRKRFIGGAIGVVGLVLQTIGNPWAIPVLALAGIVEGVGIGHWLGKKSNKYGEKDSFTWEDFMKFLADLFSKLAKKG